MEPYRKVAETLPAIDMIGQTLEKLRVSEAIWYLDRPVSNSGRLKQRIGRYAAEKGLTWTVELVQNPDKNLINSNRLIATSDSAILDRCSRWFNLCRWIIDMISPDFNLHVMDLSEQPKRPDSWISGP